MSRWTSMQWPWKWLFLWLSRRTEWHWLQSNSTNRKSKTTQNLFSPFSPMVAFFVCLNWSEIPPMQWKYKTLENLIYLSCHSMKFIPSHIFPTAFSVEFTFRFYARSKKCNRKSVAAGVAFCLLCRCLFIPWLRRMKMNDLLTSLLAYFCTSTA